MFLFGIFDIIKQIKKEEMFDRGKVKLVEVVASRRLVIGADPRVPKLSTSIDLRGCILRI